MYLSRIYTKLWKELEKFELNILLNLMGAFAKKKNEIINAWLLLFIWGS